MQGVIWHLLIMQNVIQHYWICLIVFYVYALKHVLKGSSISLLSFICFNYGRDCKIRVETSRTTMQLTESGVVSRGRLSIGYILALFIRFIFRFKWYHTRGNYTYSNENMLSSQRITLIIFLPCSYLNQLILFASTKAYTVLKYLYLSESRLKP